MAEHASLAKPGARGNAFISIDQKSFEATMRLLKNADAGLYRETRRSLLASGKKIKEAQALAAEVDAELDLARRQFAAHATVKADLARYAAHLRRVIDDTPFELRSDADEAMLAELAIKFPVADHA